MVKREQNKQSFFKKTIKSETYIATLYSVLNYTCLKIKGADISFLMILYCIFTL